MKEHKAKAQVSIYPPFLKRICGVIIMLVFLFLCALFLSLVVPGIIDFVYEPEKENRISNIFISVSLIVLFGYFMVPMVVSLLFESRINIEICKEGFLCKYPIRGTRLRQWSDFRSITICDRLTGNGRQVFLQPMISCKLWEPDRGLWKNGDLGRSRNNIYISADEEFIQELKRIKPGGVTEIRTELPDYYVPQNNN